MADTGNTAVSYAELADLVRKRVDASQASTVGARQMLLDLVHELGGRPPAGDGVRLLTDDGWRLAQIRIRGFGGVANSDPPLEIDLPPTDGVIVVRGQNGSGKTSVAEAVRRALETDTAPDPVGSKDLWQPTTLNREADSAVAEIRLRRGTDALLITIENSGEGQGSTSAVLCDAGGPRPVVLGSHWSRALVGAQVVFEYGRMQASVRTTIELQEYLEGLLLLGPVWTEVRAELAIRSDAAKSAKKALDKLRADAKKAEKALAAEFAADPRKPAALSDIAWPRDWSENVDVWLAAGELTGATEIRPLDIAGDHVDRVMAALDGVDAAWGELDRVRDELGDVPSAEVLYHLSAVADAHDLDPERCPLCSTAIRWQPVAARLLERLTGHGAAVRTVVQRVDTLVTLVREEIAPLLRVTSEGGPRDEVTGLLDAIDRGGSRARSAVREACLRLDTAVHNGYTKWIDDLRAASDASAEWQARRRGVVTDLVDRWRRDGPIAALESDWSVADRTLTELQVSLRDGRQADLTAGIGEAIGRLLPDASLELTEIEHTGGAKQARGVAVKLSIGGRPATLGMLSSGQRNALLLAPLLSLRGSAPFGFLVVDDPVHAMDDTRVDLLAHELVELGRRRQVVVFTHDARLEEHLRARDPGLTVRVLSRNPVSGIVEETDGSAPWMRLLDKAAEVKDAAEQDAWPSDLGIASSVVHGLCRAALDGAIRQLVISAAVRDGADVNGALTALDRQQSTPARLRHGMSNAGGSYPRTEHCLTERIPAWSAGTHGTADADADLKADIKAARKACHELAVLRG